VSESVSQSVSLRDGTDRGCLVGNGSNPIWADAVINGAAGSQQRLKMMPRFTVAAVGPEAKISAIPCSGRAAWIDGTIINISTLQRQRSASIVNAAEHIKDDLTFVSPQKPCGWHATLAA
jgi:hypothetical protein